MRENNGKSKGQGNIQRHSVKEQIEKICSLTLYKQKNAQPIIRTNQKKKLPAHSLNHGRGTSFFCGLGRNKIT